MPHQSSPEAPQRPKRQAWQAQEAAGPPLPLIPLLNSKPMAGIGKQSHWSPETWEQAKNATAAGVAEAEIVKGTGISLHALRKRRQREQWFSPAIALHKARKKLAELTQEAQAAQSILNKGAALPISTKVAESPKPTGNTQNGQSIHVDKGDPGPQKEGENGGRLSDPREEANIKTQALVLQQLGKNEEKASLMASNIATKLIEQAATSKKHKIKALEDIQDVAKALGVVRTANGSDKEDGKVTFNLFAPGGTAGPIDAASRFRRRVIDVRAEAVPQEV